MGRAMARRTSSGEVSGRHTPSCRPFGSKLSSGRQLAFVFHLGERRAKAILPLQRADFPSSVRLHTFEVAALAPFGQQSGELVDAGRIDLVEDSDGGGVAFVVVVAGRAGRRNSLLLDRAVSIVSLPTPFGLQRRSTQPHREFALP